MPVHTLAASEVKFIYIALIIDKSQRDMPTVDLSLEKPTCISITVRSNKSAHSNMNG